MRIGDGLGGREDDVPAGFRPHMREIAHDAETIHLGHDFSPENPKGPPSLLS